MQIMLGPLLDEDIMIDKEGNQSIWKLYKAISGGYHWLSYGVIILKNISQSTQQSKNIHPL